MRDEGEDSAGALIKARDLALHPDGGWYRETWRAEAQADERAAGTAIYFLLERTSGPIGTRSMPMNIGSRMAARRSYCPLPVMTVRWKE